MRLEASIRGESIDEHDRIVQQFHVGRTTQEEANNITDAEQALLDVFRFLSEEKQLALLILLGAIRESEERLT